MDMITNDQGHDTGNEAVAHTKDVPIQEPAMNIWSTKYRLTDGNRNPVDADISEMRARVADALVRDEPETSREAIREEFIWALESGATPAGRILANAGAEAYKPETSLINCTVSQHVEDSMRSILDGVYQAGLTLKSGAGIGYEFSLLRPNTAPVSGAGAETSGPLPFMDIYDSACKTVSSAGGRRGAQMATFDVGHPDVEDFISAKREKGRFTQFNVSVMNSDAFMEALKKDEDWALAFPLLPNENMEDHDIVWRDWPVIEDGYTVNDEGLVACRVYRTVKARDLWNRVMKSTYDHAEPGNLFIDRINDENNLWFAEVIRATNP
ncbi:ribonucleotide reductase N-terminal alpha domain-containing protein [Thioalkalivibrio sp. ALE19]|uniref:ribonucleotide reductase N-terminal alpha domain-containing protein n=1 Tax=Thioalkalivibrio sp. ALE19 TaxID=1266909 RepID=UPI000419AA8A|nr:ribonucleotide reductase N-terminal alpha domain-containing protein [Thioalkalivibrio sp. ALE19]